MKGTPCLDVDQNGGKSPAGFCVSRPRNCASDARFFSAARSIAVRWWGFCGAAATDAEALERPEPLPRVLLPFRAEPAEPRVASFEPSARAVIASAAPTNAPRTAITASACHPILELAKSPRGGGLKTADFWSY